MKFASTLLLAGLVTAGAYISTVEQADARGRRGQATVHTERGTFQGQGAVHRERGQRTRDATITGPRGGQTSVHDQRTWDRQAGAYSHDRVREFPDGTSRSVDADAVRTAPGEWDVDRIVTGRNGEVRTQSGVINTERTANGRITTGDIQTSNYGQVDIVREVSREGGVRAVDGSATFEDGTSLTRSSVGSCDGAGACTRSTELTNRAGQTTSIEESRVRDGNTVNYERDTTFADGTTRSIDRDRIGNGDGTGAINRTVTGRDGDTRTQTGEYEVERTP